MVDVIVVGAGHAGCEAALATAKMGFKTQLYTLSLEKIALMPCNPSIGGPAKGIVVREIEALGGAMGEVADRSALQFKMLNASKGPGVQCLRVQSDKDEYSKVMRQTLEKQENLELVQSMITGLVIENNKKIGIKINNDTIHSKVVILTTGTYMASTTMISSEVVSEGPDHLPTTNLLSESLRELGLELLRLKTGTPPRLDTTTVDFSKTTIQPGDSVPLRFSRFSKESDLIQDQYPCYLTYTNQDTHSIIDANIHLSSMFSGVVTGVGARYCPSIEDKIVRFANKERHQIFLEPETKEFNTIYVQGLSSSLPRNVQEQMVKTIPGLENAKILKYAYAIEYDAINPLQMKASLESMKIENLFTAGQINGTSGYEEAAGQGLLAGINAARKIQTKEPLILRRDEAYLGVMIDDLVTKGTLEPYRLLTSRSEYRLLCRHDNAYRRLSQKGYEIGLLPQEKYDSIKSMLDDVDQLIEYTKTVNLNKESPLYNYLESLGYENNDGALLFEVIKRPHVKLDKILELLEISKTEEVIHQAEIEIKYEGYINKAQKDADKLKLMEDVRIPETFNYDTVLHLANEARQKLEKVRPMSLGQAARISGVNPADIGVLAMALKRG
ncbi:MAG: tRNA uridine-5-carboxymethylaminomethyl(34) synthesis enzyme MnmG [Erysipelothrix sp.]|nr:tRNA uridine-5-carboxymethylaminomethyl(34) synthesis enzyme MnmG [Erysipelothrix sp.]